MTVSVTKEQRVRIEELKKEEGKKYIYESPDGGKTVYAREFEEPQKISTSQQDIMKEILNISLSLREVKENIRAISIGLCPAKKNFRGKSLLSRLMKKVGIGR